MEVFPVQNGEPQIYTSLTTLRNAQVQPQWSFFQLFFVFNSAALSVVLGDKQIDELLKFILSGSGFLTHCGLCFASKRAIDWLTYYDNKLAQLEEFDREESGGNKARIEVFSDYRLKERKGGKLAQHGYLLPLGLGTAVWIILTADHAVLWLLTLTS